MNLVWHQFKRIEIILQLSQLITAALFSVLIFELFLIFYRCAHTIVKASVIKTYIEN